MQKLEILGAREHNLQNIDIDLPRNQLVVFTGLSGSGKSSLAFDTIYAEGQRRYMETFSAYARQFIGNMERPDVDSINGLSPVISIEQKTTNKNPRSTVGTVTEIYDFVRLLFARVADAYSHVSGKKMIRYSEQQILNIIAEDYSGKEILILAPLVRSRKGHYRELFQQIAKKGYLRVRVDGEIRELTYNMQVDRYKTHDIELVVDRIRVGEKSMRRLEEAIKSAFKQGKGMLMVLDNTASSNDPSIRYFSRMLMDPDSGISYPEPEPNTFSFNSPYGACPHCNGLGEISEIDIKKIIPNPDKSIRGGGLDLLGKYSPNNYLYRQLENLGRRYNFTVDDPLNTISEEAMNAILYGTSDYIGINDDGESGYRSGFPGIANYINEMATDEQPASLQKWAASFMNTVPCPSCHGHRLKKESLCFLVDGKNIGEVANMNLTEFYEWSSKIEEKLEPSRRTVAHEILREINTRTKFLLDVGVGYLSLNRASKSLSGGESQRIRLATQIGAKLVNVLYILDEPSIGLHQRDNRRLIDALKELRDLGNSVIVVEHDRDMILSADYVVDIGPGAGVRGGKIVASGPLDKFLKHKTLTCDYLNRVRDIELPIRRDTKQRKHIVLEGATGNNLKDVTLDIPLGLFVCVTGVSGSGKSSLINETLHPILNQHFYHSQKRPLPYRKITGIDNIDKVIEIDQAPIGRTPRSNPATYVGIFDENGQELDYGERGEVRIKTTSLTCGYIDHPELTRARIRDGWLLTQDLGMLDSSGKLFIYGRMAQHVVARGGEKVYLFDIANRLREDPAVKDALVCRLETENGPIVAHVVLEDDIRESDKENVLRRLDACMQTFLPSGLCLAGYRMAYGQLRINTVEKIDRSYYTHLLTGYSVIRNGRQEAVAFHKPNNTSLNK